MRKDKDEIESVQLPVLAVGLWLGYLLILAGIDHLFYSRPVFRLPFYLVNFADGFTVLGLSFWIRGRSWPMNWLFPLIVTLLSLIPVVSGNLIVLRSPPSPAVNAEAIMLRLLPMTFIPLVLTAWKYRWRYVVIYTVAMAGLNLGLHAWFHRPGGAPFLPPLTAFIIQAVSFLLVGYFISTLMNRLREQNQSLEMANAQLVHYASTLEDLAISRERNRLARELHDTLAHTLSALTVQLETAKAYFDVDINTAKELIDKSLQAMRSGLTETRGALKALRAGPLEDLGLLLALRRISTEAAERAKLKLHLSLPDKLDSLAPEVEQAVFRITQEAVANVIHHAAARNLKVQLDQKGKGLVLVVSDDGLGFTVQQDEAKGRFGLSGMRERAQLIGGDLTVISHPDQGTTIKLAL